MSGVSLPVMSYDPETFDYEKYVRESREAQGLPREVSARAIGAVIRLLALDGDEEEETDRL